MKVFRLSWSGVPSFTYVGGNGFVGVCFFAFVGVLSVRFSCLCFIAGQVQGRIV